MGKNKKIRKRIDTLELRIHEHNLKIIKEKDRSNPDAGLIKHWEKEITAWEKETERLQKRLPGRE